MRRRSALLCFGLVVACGAPVPEEPSEAGNLSRPASAVSPKAEIESAIPRRFHGTYDRSLAECGTPSVHRLVVDADSLRFHESLAEVQQIEIEGPNAIAVASDYQGEGESWSARQRLELSESGERLTLIGDGTETVRVRCRGTASSASSGWEGSASGEGDGLWLTKSTVRALTLFCPARDNVLIVNVPAFRAVGSEERMSFGSGGTVVTLVADFRGDPDRGGVTGRGPVPAELDWILSSPEGIAINYGAQNAGPHRTPPAELAAAFVAGCRD